MVDGIQRNFYKKVLRIPRNAAKRTHELLFVRDSRRGTILCDAIKHWIRVEQNAEVEPMRKDYDWQVGRLRVERWARRQREEMDTIGLEYIWQNAIETKIRSVCHIIKLRCAESEDRID